MREPDTGGWLARPRRVGREIATRLLRERATPARLGWAVGLGALIGTTPFYGLHLGITIVVATLLGLNRAITYLAANVSLPMFAPFLAFGSIQIGTVLLTGRPLPLSVGALQEVGPWTFGAAWLLGSLVLGTVIGAPAGVTTYALVRAYRRRHPLPVDPIDALFARTAARYAGAGEFDRRYIRGKLRHDPVYRRLAESAAPPPIVDVGSGRGQTLLLFAERDPGVIGVGIDWDERKVAMARRAAVGVPGVRFERDDVRTAAYPPAATILMLDVLHYNAAEVQDDMLERAARALLPGGVLYVRDVDAAAGWRATLTEWQERLGCALRLNHGQTLAFRPIADVRATLARAGLDVEIAPTEGGAPLANVLLVARRR